MDAEGGMPQTAANDAFYTQAHPKYNDRSSSSQNQRPTQSFP